MITRCAYLCFNGAASLVAQTLKILPAVQKTCLVSGSGRSPGEGNGNPLQYSCLENSMDRVAWWATVHRVTKSGTRLSLIVPAHISEEADLLIRSTLVGPCLCCPSYPILSSLELGYNIHKYLVTTWLDCSPPPPPPLPLLTRLQVLEFS